MLLDGKLLSNKIKNELKEEIANLSLKHQRVPHLVIILVGNNEASQIYVKNKLKACKYIGMQATLVKKDESITTDELIDLINIYNKSLDVDGIIVQLPLPKHINEQLIINTIDESKDVDGFGIVNKGLLFSGLNSLKSATPYGIIKLLEAYNVNFDGLHAVIIGRSNIVGKPMAMMLLEKNCTVTICHSRTKNLKDITKTADILVAAVGKPKFVTIDMVKDNAIVVDVGINRLEDGLCGDVDFCNLVNKAQLITPVPGGVGPLTITMLLENTLTAFKNKFKE